MQDLNTLLTAGTGWQITGASSINNAGQIVGTGQLNGGPPRAVLLTTPSQLIGKLVDLVQSFNQP